MVQVSIFAALALFSSLAAGLPYPQDDSAIGIEVAVSAPNGIPITDSVELASQSSREAAAATPAAGLEIAQGKPNAQLKVEVPAHVTSIVHAPVHAPSPVHVPIHTTSPVHIPVHVPSPVHAPVVVHNPIPVHVTKVIQHKPEPATHIVLPTHGSGAVVWNNHEQYNDCVQQCIATHGNAPGHYVPTPTQTVGSHGTGATHTVIVAPSQGVLRYIPFAVNATVGDTIKFMWGANNHTVTKSSQLLPCNRTSDALFASGRQDKDFVFTQVVNDTNPTYFFCGTPGHCQQGMYGIINPATQFASTTSIGRQIQTIAQNSSSVAAYAAYAREQTKGNALAANWGSNIDIASVPEWAHESFAENVLFTRVFLAANQEVMNENGDIDLSTMQTTPLVIPQDIASVLNNAGSGAAISQSATSESATAPAAAASAPSADNSPAPVSGNLSSSGSSLASPKALVALAAIFATFLL